ncbi:DUF1800 domain-containing protein [Tahibacter amnicola]|uniref:DUF1800 domain-containing protein n=1 Tax=Tahibacter amnicola TaxID=2976241 RepID=A0ABY6BC94_9GAMM|nr:DUF1800 domain-containing protein [Tahibacter amnicola]UXI66740.1 DUF1800 domain-containing protein [Tahibacter amnicola]
MPRQFLVGIAAVVCAAAFSATAQARTFFRSGFESPTDIPATDAQAARFLTQATFGPTTADIARVRTVGLSRWIDEQFNVPPTTARSYLEAVDAANGTSNGIGHTQRYDRWFHTAAYGQDQLRQRMAWALSQIFVISDQNGTLAGEPLYVAEYWDMLARDGFGYYRQLLENVTLNQSMGKYLSHFRNKKASATSEPDENYAREIMQLFSIGLIERDLDFSPILDGQNQPVPTYDQNVITQLAKLFTGLNYANATNINNGSNSLMPMTCITAEHDFTAKTVLGGVVLPANAPSCLADIRAGLDLIAAHSNVAPFISRQLIQRFVTSNPSPEYIERVAQVFLNNGDGEIGDLRAVLKAILLDSEARNNAPPANFGKLREPLLRLTAMWRAWNAQPPPTTQFGEINMGIPAFGNYDYGQKPLSAPTVFNFYEPDYQPPGPLAEAHLFAPEFQIINESTTYSISNSLARYSFESYVGMSSPPADRPLLNLTALAAIATPAAMVEDANQRMMYGAMSANMKTALTNMLTFMNGANNLEKARSLVQLIAMSPEYATQR